MPVTILCLGGNVDLQQAYSALIQCVAFFSIVVVSFYDKFLTNPFRPACMLITGYGNPNCYGDKYGDYYEERNNRY